MLPAGSSDPASHRCGATATCLRAAGHPVIGAKIGGWTPAGLRKGAHKEAETRFKFLLLFSFALWPRISGSEAETQFFPGLTSRSHGEDQVRL